MRPTTSKDAISRNDDEQKRRLLVLPVAPLLMTMIRTQLLTKLLAMLRTIPLARLLAIQLPLA